MEPANNKYKVFGDEVYERRVIHRFTLGDVEDPDIYCAGPILEWQKTEHGKWVMTHGRDQTYHTVVNPVNYGYEIVIWAWITPKRWTEYCLRFVDNQHP